MSFWPGEQQVVRMPRKDKFSPYFWLVACYSTRLERWALLPLVLLSRFFPRVLCRFQSLGASRWEPPNLPSDLDLSFNMELLGPYWRFPHCLAPKNWGCLPGRNSSLPPLIIYQVSCEDRGREDFLGCWESLKQCFPGRGSPHTVVRNVLSASTLRKAVYCILPWRCTVTISRVKALRSPAAW